MARGLCFELFFGNLSHCSSSPFGQLFFIWLHLKVHTMAKSTVYIAVKMKRILHCNSLSLMSWKLCVSRFASQWLCYCSLWSHLQYEVIWWVCLMWNWLIVSIKKSLIAQVLRLNPYSSVLCAPSSTLSHLKNLFCHFVSNPLVHAVVEMSCILVLLRCF